MLNKTISQGFRDKKLTWMVIFDKDNFDEMKEFDGTAEN